MDKEIFLNFFRNKLLSTYIFRYINYYHRDVLKVTSYKWVELLELYPDLLLSLGYVSDFKRNYKRFKYCTAMLEKILKSSIMIGDEEIFRLILSEKLPNQPNTPAITISVLRRFLVYAAEYGRFEMLKGLESAIGVKIQHSYYFSALVAAPLSKNMDLIQYLTKMLNGYAQLYIQNTRFKTAFDSAAYVGSVEIIEWLAQNRSCDRNQSNMYYSAISGGHLHVIQYLAEKDINNHPTSMLIDFAAEANRLDIVQFLHYSKIGNCSPYAMDKAVENENLQMVKWLHENRTEGCTKNAMEVAAIKNNFEIIHFLHENTTQGCTSATMDEVAGVGTLEMVKWLHKNRTEGCTKKAILNSIFYNKLDTVRFLINNRTENKLEDVVESAILHENQDILEWLLKNLKDKIKINK